MEPLKLECFKGRSEDMNEFNKFISSMQQSKKNLIKYNLQVGIAPLFVNPTRDKTVTIGGVQNWEGVGSSRLPKLSALVIKDDFIYGPAQVVEILGAATSDVEEKGSDAFIKFHLPKLRELRLRKLPNLKRICSKSGVMPFAYAPPSLIINSTTEWWKSLEWDDHPNFKNVLQPLWKQLCVTTSIAAKEVDSSSREMVAEIVAMKPMMEVGKQQKMLPNKMMDEVKSI
ncbi:hypothetical protein Goklo_012528 [Gossypium klotzschianum]|uniref:Uncharacterized protein n=1 Tax=Gossypium klotzschianum TaxID=34286 RepID=A0A7J8VDI7_9ROSI|nr:hypothetical protein [Gossypium klotzschianum]